MKYTNIVKNAYPNISLHDCKINKIEHDSNGLYFYFKEGFCLDAETETDGQSMLLVNVNLEDISFYLSKSYRLIRGRMPIYITKYKEIKDVQKLLKKGKYFEIVDEFYHENEILWKGEIFIDKKQRRECCGYFEFHFYSSDNINLIYYYNKN